MSQQISIESVRRFRDSLREAEIMTRSGMADDSLRLSGELLAEASFRLDGAENGHAATTSAELFAEADVVHVNALIATDEPAAAVSTAVASLTRLCMTGCHTADCDMASMMLLDLAATSLVTYMRVYETEPSADVKEHYATVLRYIASMLYHSYTRLNRVCQGSPLLPPVYKTLRHLIDEGVPVDNKEIEVNNSHVDPDNPLPVYSDAIGRLRAVGFEF